MAQKDSTENPLCKSAVRSIDEAVRVLAAEAVGPPAAIPDLWGPEAQRVARLQLAYSTISAQLLFMTQLGCQPLDFALDHFTYSRAATVCFISKREDRGDKCLIATWKRNDAK